MTNKEVYQQITTATSLQDGLVQHFSYLVDTPAYAGKMQKVLEQIMKQATGVELDDDRLMVHFTKDNGDAVDWECSPPAAAPDKQYPASFRRCLQKHSRIHCEDLMFDLAECDTDLLGKMNWERLGIEDPENLVCLGATLQKRKSYILPSDFKNDLCPARHPTSSAKIKP
jgi:hypothetical protein